MITTSLVFLGLCAINLASGFLCPPPFHYWEGMSDFYQKPPPEAFMTTPELIKNYNYPAEIHEVPTADNYILTIFRIPYSNKTKGPVEKEPVLIQHGLVCSSDDWFMLKPESNLPFMLADLGHDVWIGNARGNRYSQKHYDYDVDDSAFWDFTYHEMGVYDVPAMMKYILRRTGKERLSYVGHSMGTTMFFIAMDKHRELQQKVRKMIALSPVAYVSHIKTPFGLLAIVPSPIYAAFTALTAGGRMLYKPFSDFLKSFGPYVCSGNVPACVCQSVLFFIAGYDFSQCTDHTVSIVTGHTPSDTSGKTLDHYRQWVRSGHFAEYDHGVFGNWMRYGTAHPPKYSLKANKVETFVMYSKNDWLVQPPDAERAIRELGNVTAMQVLMEEFSHMDFQYAMDVKKEVYDHCVDFLAT